MGDKYQAYRRDPKYLRVQTILGITKINSSRDIDQMNEYLRIHGDPYQNQLDEANARAESIRNQSVQDLAANRDAFNTTLANLTSQFESNYANLQSSFDERYNSLNDVLIQQQADFAVQRDQLSGQLAESQAMFANQQRLAANQANAVVPTANRTAMSATTGDERTTGEQPTISRRRKDNALSSLSILSGLGTQDNPTAGLQIA